MNKPTRFFITVLAPCALNAASYGAQAPPQPMSASTCTTARCLENLAAKHCVGRNAGIDRCQAFLKDLQALPGKDKREQQLLLGVALGGAADLSDAPAQREAYRKQQTAVYRGLLERDAKDAQAILGLATIATGRSERIALLKDAVSADPSNTIVLRALATELANGTPQERTEALSYLRQAYERARAPHRWHFASMVYSELIASGAEEEARAFAKSVRETMGVPGAVAVIKEAVAAAGDPNEARTFKALATVCESNAVRLEGRDQCRDAVADVADVTARKKVQLSTQSIDAIATASLNLLSEAGADDPTADSTRRSVENSIKRVRSVGLNSALLLHVQAQMLLMDAPTAAQERTALLEQAVALEPKSGEAKMRLASEYMSQQRFLNAAKQLEAAIPLLAAYKRSAAQSNLLVALRAGGERKRADELQQRWSKEADQ